MKKIKLKFIENGRLSDGKLNLILGGAGWSCGTYTNCHSTGKNSCKPWTACSNEDKDKKTECSDDTALEWVHYQANPTNYDSLHSIGQSQI